MKETSNNKIGIPEVLASLRNDLDKAQDALSKTGTQPMLKLDTAEIELAVSISQSSDAGGKIGLNVLGIGLGVDTKKTTKEQSTHKVKITLKPYGTVAVAGSQK